MRSCQLTRGEKIGKNQRLTHHWSSFCQKKRVAKKADIDDKPVEKISRQLVDGVLFTT